MATVNNTFYVKRETLVRYIQESAQFILDNAEDLVGNYHAMTGLDITIGVDIQSAPEVTLNRRYITAGWNIRKQGFEEYANDDQGTTGDDRLDEGDIPVQG